MACLTKNKGVYFGLEVYFIGQGGNSQKFLRKIIKIFVTFRSCYEASIHKKIIIWDFSNCLIVFFPFELKTKCIKWNKFNQPSEEKLAIKKGSLLQVVSLLMTLFQETHEKYFYGTEHWNYFTNDEDLGPVILSLKQENINGRDQFR